MNIWEMYTATIFRVFRVEMIFILMIEAVCSFKTLLSTCQVMWCYNLKDHNMNSHFHENSKLYVSKSKVSMFLCTMISRHLDGMEVNLQTCLMSVLNGEWRWVSALCFGHFNPRERDMAKGTISPPARTQTLVIQIVVSHFTKLTVLAVHEVKYSVCVKILHFGLWNNHMTICCPADFIYRFLILMFIVL
jgi:hypothetical protein